MTPNTVRYACVQLMFDWTYLGVTCCKESDVHFRWGLPVVGSPWGVETKLRIRNVE